MDFVLSRAVCEDLIWRKLTSQLFNSEQLLGVIGHLRLLTLTEDPTNRT